MIPNSTVSGIFGAANSKRAHSLLKENNITILENGLISGVSAELLILAKDIDAYIFLANPGNSTNFDSAAKLLDLLAKIFDFKINTQPLEQESKKIIATLKEKMQQMYDQQKSISGNNKDDGNKGLMFT